MCIFKWIGPEFGLRSNVFVVTEFTIEKESADNKKGKFLEGTIVTKDYIEHGFETSDKWYAVGVIDKWDIKMVPGKDNIYNEEHKAVFTSDPSLDFAIRKFIFIMLNGYLSRTIKPEPQKYIGEKEEYKGSCVCKKLANSSKKNPFPWKTITNRGNFPENCFTCSCGKNWFCINCNENIWVEVKDEKAWKMLILYNGVVIKKIGIYEGGIYLLQSLCDQGLIPLN